MTDVSKMVVSFVFLFILTLPISYVLFNTYGVIAALLFVVAPIGWFILDSDLSHYEMDKYL